MSLKKINNSFKRILKAAAIILIIYSINTKGLQAPKNKKCPEEDFRKIVVIDPGHGMSNRVKEWMDWGKTYLDYKEAEIVLEKAKNIKEMLDSTKYNVVLTRKDNNTPCPIEYRPELANRLNADIFLSLHLNDFKNWKTISGSEIYWRYDEGKELANLVARNLEEIASIPNRVVMKEDYLMLKEIKCPAVLIELGYLLNEKDRNIILDENTTEKAVIKTIEEYLK